MQLEAQSVNFPSDDHPNRNDGGLHCNCSSLQTVHACNNAEVDQERG